jgi:hypothetical protein
MYTLVRMKANHLLVAAIVAVAALLSAVEVVALAGCSG